jgi:hypothetical protein
MLAAIALSDSSRVQNSLLEILAWPAVFFAAAQPNYMTSASCSVSCSKHLYLAKLESRQVLPGKDWFAHLAVIYDDSAMENGDLRHKCDHRTKETAKKKADEWTRLSSDNVR